MPTRPVDPPVETVVDLDACARTLVARMATRQEAARQRAAALRERAREAAALLSARLGARRTWLFGSLAWGSPHEASDVDLLVEGLPQAAAGAAEDLVADLIRPAGVDLVRVEDAPAGLVERVRREGVMLHDAG